MNQNNSAQYLTQATVSDIGDHPQILNPRTNNLLSLIFGPQHVKRCKTKIIDSDADSIIATLFHIGEIFQRGISENNVDLYKFNRTNCYRGTDFVMTVFLFIFYLIDIIFDIYLTVSLYESKLYFILSVVILLISNFFASFMSFILYLVYVRKGYMTVSWFRWDIIVCSHLLLLGTLYRFLCCITFGWKYLHCMDEEKKQSYIHKALLNDEVLSCLSTLELFLETLPQLSLQLYIMILHYKVEDDDILSEMKIGWESLADWQAARVTYALVNVACSLVFISQSYKRTNDNSGSINKRSILILSLGNLFIIAPRIFGFVLFAILYKSNIFIFCLVHWFIIFVFYAKDLKFCKMMSQIPFWFIPFIIILLLCHLFYIGESIFGNRKHFFLFHLFMYLENILLIVLWYIAVPQPPWYHDFILELVVMGFWIGIALLWIQENCFHSKQKSEEINLPFVTNLHGSIDNIPDELSVPPTCNITQSNI